MVESPWRVFQEAQKTMFLPKPPLSLFRATPDPEIRVLGRTVEQWIHEKVPVPFDTLQSRNSPGWNQTHLADTLNRAFNSIHTDKFPDNFTPDGAILPNAAVAHLSWMRRNKVIPGEQNTTSYAHYARFLPLPELSLDPVVRAAAQETNPANSLYCDNPMADLLARHNITPEWVITAWKNQPGNSVPLQVNARLLPEPQLLALLSQHGDLRKGDESFAEILFFAATARKKPLSASTLTILQEACLAQRKPRSWSSFGKPGGGGVQPAEHNNQLWLANETSVVEDLLLWSVNLPAETLRWMFNNMRIAGSRVEVLHRLTLLRVLNDGMLRDWYRKEGVDGLPYEMLYEMLELQFPTWESLQGLPLNDPEPLAGSFPGCRC